MSHAGNRKIPPEMGLGPQVSWSNHRIESMAPGTLSDSTGPYQLFEPIWWLLFGRYSQRLVQSSIFNFRARLVLMCNIPTHYHRNQYLSVRSAGPSAPTLAALHPRNRLPMFFCSIPGCTSQGFTEKHSISDLNRHQTKSKKRYEPKKPY
ncbi:hypothetical protein L218DRAFT_1055118 [Marasmius fiardii PR-910]|nr:hypothetical protein L218DRAFT_1055118 [Marasmius fiardii PR-910]